MSAIGELNEIFNLWVVCLYVSYLHLLSKVSEMNEVYVCCGVGAGYDCARQLQWR